jgi:hypothetical protein
VGPPVLFGGALRLEGEGADSNRRSDLVTISKLLATSAAPGAGRPPGRVSHHQKGHQFDDKLIASLRSCCASAPWWRRGGSTNMEGDWGEPSMMQKNLAGSRKTETGDSTALASEQEGRERSRGKLRLVHSPTEGVQNSGWRHSLDGQLVESGELLCVMLANGHSLVGRYRWSGVWADNPELEMLLKDHAVARFILPPNAHVERIDKEVI